MDSKIALVDIIELVSRLRIKIDRYRSVFQRNEMLVRYALIDPMLRVLGWDIEDPEQVIPEFNTDAGIPDYALKIDGNIVAFLEAKALGKPWDVLKLISYANAKGVPYVIASDGDVWEVYDVFKPVEVKTKLVVSWQITRDSPAEIALKAITIANLRSEETFGRRPSTPVLAQERIEKKDEEMLKHQQELIEGPINARIAKRLVLQILAEAGKPMRGREIIEEVGRRVKLTEYDLKIMPGKGIPRWVSIVGHAICNLTKKGFVEKVQKGVYKIAEKGLEELKENSY